MEPLKHRPDQRVRLAAAGLAPLVEASGRRESLVRYRIVPQVLACGYYWLSWLLYTLRPSWSHSLDGDFEEHAEHEYAEFVRDNPGLEDQRSEGRFCAEYGRFDSVADLLRQIGHDERVHEKESLARMTDARFR